MIARDLDLPVCLHVRGDAEIQELANDIMLVRLVLSFLIEGFWELE